ncbi:hypothetical protein ACEV7R_23845, partial [Vibrio parahaemolyticus]
HMSAAALKLLDRLAEAAAERRGVAAGEALSQAVLKGLFVRRIAVALQRGVARLEQAAVACSVNSHRSRVARGVAAPARGVADCAD